MIIFILINTELGCMHALGVGGPPPVVIITDCILITNILLSSVLDSISNSHSTEPFLEACYSFKFLFY